MGIQTGSGDEGPDNKHDSGTGSAPSTLNKDVGTKGLSYLLSDTTFLIIVGSLSGLIALIAVIVCFVVYRKRRGGKRNSRDLEWDHADRSYVTKSAPISRSSSPKVGKRKSCPDATTLFGGVMVRSMTTEGIPDFTLPPERVQPTEERSYSLSGVQMSQIQCNTLGTLQPDLYQSYGTEDDNVFQLPPSDHGRLWFSLIYDAAIEQLQVTLIKVRELEGRGRDNTARDPYVKVFLFPDERNCRVSKVKKKTLSPIYNETFMFQVAPEDIADRTLRFSVYDVDKRRVRHSLGHVLVNLKDLDLTKGDSLWRDLESSSKLSATSGELGFSLNYLTNMDKVKIIILSARNLRHINYDRDTGVYVRLQMMHGRKVYKTKKTVTQRANCNPTFNESFSFNISGKVLDNCSFEIALMRSSKTPLGNDEVYGRIVIGSFMFSRGEELLHWQEMLSNARTAVTKWHALTACDSIN